MARAYASRVLKAPIQFVWSIVRDFNALPKWGNGVLTSAIEDEQDSACVGCIRSFRLDNGKQVRERLLMLDDVRFCYSYNLESQSFPLKNYLATLRLYSVTHTEETFAEWKATFDEPPDALGVYESFLSKDVFAAHFESLANLVECPD